MNLVDAAVLTLIALSAILGFTSGLVREVLGVAAWMGAAFTAFFGFPFIQPVMRRLITNSSIADPVGYAALFLTALILLWIVKQLLSNLVRDSLLSGLDRALGIFFGIFRGVLLVAVGYVLGGLLVTSNQWPYEVRAARSLPYIYQAAKWGIHLMPERLKPPLQPPPSTSAAPSASQE